MAGDLRFSKGARIDFKFSRNEEPEIPKTLETARTRKLGSRSAGASEPLQKRQLREEQLEEEEQTRKESQEDDKENTKGDSDQNSADRTTPGIVNLINNEENETIELLLESFEIRRLRIPLTKAAKKHPDVADEIRKVADEDPFRRKIFVYRLGMDTKAETLIEAFKQYGEIEDCNVVTDKISEKSKGYGTILFKSRSGACNAVKEPEKKIGNSMAACQLASICPSLLDPQRKIYVRQVSAEIDPQSLYTFFSRYGEIEFGPLGMDKATGKFRGYCGFVYKTIDGAERALEERSMNFEGLTLHCRKGRDDSRGRRERNDNTGGYNTPGHLVAPNHSSMGDVSATQVLNPTLGQAQAALLASHGAALYHTPAFGQAWFGALGPAAAVNPLLATGGVPDKYGIQVGITPGYMPGYGSQNWYQNPDPNQQASLGSAGSGQYFDG